MPERYEKSDRPGKDAGRIINDERRESDVGKHQGISKEDQEQGGRGTEIEWEQNQEKEIRKP